MTATVYPASILTTSDKNAYVPINGEASAEEIGLQAINHVSDEKAEPVVSNSHLISKIALLIGLCKPKIIKFNLFFLIPLVDIIQGIPLGLVFGSIPYMLKSMKANTLSYSQFGLFSLAGYPYSLKLLWSPIVDSIYSRRVGRRKSWVLPVQLAVGVVFFVLGRSIDSWLIPGKPVDFWRLNGCFLLLVTLCATLDIAVDGWALTLLPANKIHWASTCQSVGINIGLFVSFTIFLALSSERFCSEFLGRSKQLFTLGQFMRFWALAYAGTTILLFAVKERLPDTLAKKHAGKSNWSKIVSGYRTLLEIIRLPTVAAFATILLSFKFGFSAYDAVAPLKMLEKGFPKEYLALTVLIDFPFQMVMGFLAAKWSAGKNTFRPWIIATYLRFLMSFVGLYVISRFPVGNLTGSYAALIVTTTVLTSFCHTIMFVSLVKRTLYLHVRIDYLLLFVGCLFCQN